MSAAKKDAYRIEYGNREIELKPAVQRVTKPVTQNNRLFVLTPAGLLREEGENLAQMRDCAERNVRTAAWLGVGLGVVLGIAICWWASLLGLLGGY